MSKKQKLTKWALILALFCVLVALLLFYPFEAIIILNALIFTASLWSFFGHSIETAVYTFGKWIQFRYSVMMKKIRQWHYPAPSIFNKSFARPL